MRTYNKGQLNNIIYSYHLLNDSDEKSNEATGKL